MCIRMTNKIGWNKYIFPVAGFAPDFLMRLKVLHEGIAGIRQRQCKPFFRDKLSNVTSTVVDILPKYKIAVFFSLTVLW